MKNIFFVTALSLFVNDAFANVDFYASDGLEYESIIIKLSDSGVGEAYNKQASGHRHVITLQNKYGTPLTFSKVFTDPEGPLVLNSPFYKNGLNRYYKMIMPADKKTDSYFINDILDGLSDDSNISLVYPESKPVNAYQEINDTGYGWIESIPQQLLTAPLYTDIQYYLKSPTELKTAYKLGGINAFNAHKKYQGSKGDGITIVSNEIGRWQQSHLNLPKAVFSIGDPNQASNYHDTMSMGIMAGLDNGSGVVGVAHEARFAYVSSNADHLARAIKKLNPGDVVQVGIQLVYNNLAGCKEKCYTPMEMSSHWFDVIKTATDSGIHVIEAGANGGLNLDHSDFKGKFNRSFRDSGAIIAGAVCGKSGAGASFSSYGSRVDSAAWGCGDIVTTTHDNVGADLWTANNEQHTSSYSGTSSSNPIIAGAVASLSGISKANGIKLTPIEMRKILTETGTHVTQTLGPVGTQPNIMAAAERILDGHVIPPLEISITGDNTISSGQRSSLLAEGTVGRDLTYIWSVPTGFRATEFNKRELKFVAPTLDEDMDFLFTLDVSDEKTKEFVSTSYSIKVKAREGGEIKYDFEYPDGFMNYKSGDVVKFNGQGIYQCFGPWAVHCNKHAMLPGVAADPNWVSQQWKKLG